MLRLASETTAGTGSLVCAAAAVRTTVPRIAVLAASPGRSLSSVPTNTGKVVQVDDEDDEAGSNPAPAQSRLGVDTPLPPQNDGGSKTAVASSSSSDAKAGAATATARSGERRGAPKPISFAPAPTPPGPPRASGANIAYAGLTSLIGISTVAATGAVIQPDFPLLIGSFGASCALLFGVESAPFSQPRAVIGGHVVSAAAGALAWEAVGGIELFAGFDASPPLAVAGAVMGMMATRTMHPPAAGTALIATIGADSIHDLGLIYPLVPVFSGAVTLVAVATLVHNMHPTKKYPADGWF